MKKLIVLMVLGLVTSCLLMGCGKQEAKARDINEETDKCEVCNMSVMDNQFATQLLTTDGKTLVFDDIGCMYGWMKDNEDQTDVSFVRDYNTEEWIQSGDAYYVYDQDVKTPMAYNVISFEKKADAEAYIKENDGELLDSKEVEKHEWKMNRDMMNGHGEGHSHGEEGHSHGESDDHGEDHSHDESNGDHSE